jgi:hypothetical protein
LKFEFKGKWRKEIKEGLSKGRRLFKGVVRVRWRKGSRRRISMEVI